MPSKYRIGDHQQPHFISFATVQWVDALSRYYYKDIVIDSLKYCQEHKGLKLYAYVIMSNHVHLVASAKKEANLSDILRDFKKFTSKKLLKAIEDNFHESRRKWLMWIFKKSGEYNSNNTKYQFWQQDNRPIELSTSHMLYQRIEYIHNNPIAEGIVREQHHYIYSSAINFAGKTGLLQLDEL